LHSIASDVQMEKMLARDLLFRKFCGLAADAQPSSHDTISRFRRKLASHYLMIKQGQVSIMDASIICAVIRP
jgi:transposase